MLARLLANTLLLCWQGRWNKRGFSVPANDAATSSRLGGMPACLSASCLFAILVACLPACLPASCLFAMLVACLSMCVCDQPCLYASLSTMLFIYNLYNCDCDSVNLGMSRTRLPVLKRFYCLILVRFTVEIVN